MKYKQQSAKFHRKFGETLLTVESTSEVPGRGGVAECEDFVFRKRKNIKKGFDVFACESLLEDASFR